MQYKESNIKRNNRVAIYVRVSTVYQADKDSLPMQKQELISYAKLMLGTDDVVIFEDAGYSGKNTIRPKFQEMMEKIRSVLLRISLFGRLTEFQETCSVLQQCITNSKARRHIRK